MPYWVYILQNEVTGKLYKGQTSDLEKRIERHGTDETRTRRLPKKLFISKATVKSHLRNIYGKLNVSKRREAVAEAKKIGIL
jgi:DNA-binding CsgD family transcriptional regulator